MITAPCGFVPTFIRLDERELEVDNDVGPIVHSDPRNLMAMNETSTYRRRVR